MCMLHRGVGDTITEGADENASSSQSTPPKPDESGERSDPAAEGDGWRILKQGWHNRQNRIEIHDFP